MLRRIPRIICPRCGRPRVTTRLGWHRCPAVSEEHRQNRATGCFWLVAALLLLAVLTFPLIRFWP